MHRVRSGTSEFSTVYFSTETTHWRPILTRRETETILQSQQSLAWSSCTVTLKQLQSRLTVVEYRRLTGKVVFLELSEIWTPSSPLLLTRHRLAGQVVKASAPKAEGPGFKSHLRRDFSGSSHTSDLKIGTPVATLPGAWRYRVSAGTGRPGVSML